MRLNCPQNLGHPIKAYSGALNTGTLTLEIQIQVPLYGLGSQHNLHLLA